MRNSYKVFNENITDEDFKSISFWGSTNTVLISNSEISRYDPVCIIYSHETYWENKNRLDELGIIIYKIDHYNKVAFDETNFKKVFNITAYFKNVIHLENAYPNLDIQYIFIRKNLLDFLINEFKNYGVSELTDSFLFLIVKIKEQYYSVLHADKSDSKEFYQTMNKDFNSLKSLLSYFNKDDTTKEPSGKFLNAQFYFENDAFKFSDSWIWFLVFRAFSESIKKKYTNDTNQAIELLKSMLIQISKTQFLNQLSFELDNFLTSQQIIPHQRISKKITRAEIIALILESAEIPVTKNSSNDESRTKNILNWITAYRKSSKKE